jgi:hypothetical protein
MAALILLGGCVSHQGEDRGADAPHPAALHAICAADAVLPSHGIGICTQVLAPAQDREREASIAAHPTDPNTILVTWRNGELDAATSIEAAYTNDAGAHWAFTALHDPALPAMPFQYTYSWDSTARFGPEGTGYILYGGEQHRTDLPGGAVATPDYRMTLAATRDGKTWTYHSFDDGPAALATSADYMDLAVAPDTGRLVVVAYADAVPPAVAAPTSAPEGIWSWTSDDHGATWSTPTIADREISSSPQDPFAASEQTNPRVLAGPGGLVLLTTNTLGPLANLTSGCHPCSGVSGVLTISHDGGTSWGEPRPIYQYSDPDGFLFNDPSSIWTDATGLHAALVYGENGNVTGLRSDDGGLTWTAPVHLAATPPGTRHVFLRAEARDAGVWASYRWGSNDPPRFGASILHWTPSGVENLTVADWPSNGIPTGRTGYGDDYGAVAVTSDGTAWMAFADGESGGERVRVAHVAP